MDVFSQEQRVDEIARDREDGVIIGEDEANNGQADSWEEDLRGGEQQDGWRITLNKEPASRSNERGQVIYHRHQCLTSHPPIPYLLLSTN